MAREMGERRPEDGGDDDASHALRPRRRLYTYGGRIGVSPTLATVPLQTWGGIRLGMTAAWSSSVSPLLLRSGSSNQPRTREANRSLRARATCGSSLFVALFLRLRLVGVGSSRHECLGFAGRALCETTTAKARVGP